VDKIFDKKMNTIGFGEDNEKLMKISLDDKDK
jgi:hypothetical protein